MLRLRLNNRRWLLALLLCATTSPVDAASWSVARVNHVTLTPPAGTTVAEMSGVTYLGSFGGAHRFVAVEETKGELIQFDLSLSAAGGISGISNVTAIDIVPTSDFEGIAYAGPERHSVFLAAETGAGLRELSLSSGSVMQTVTLPAVFGNVRPNLSFESLTRSVDHTTMWIANEQSLTVDGPVATPSQGTMVRLVRMSVDGNAVTVGPQFAYVTESIHGASTFGSPQSGLSDLTAMPDGTLLALERSVALGSPLYLNRIFEISLAGATDVSVAPFSSGLLGQAVTPVGKSLLWSGAVDGALGQNMEGLALGPRLTHNQWSLIGVVDNGDASSGNTIVAFTATLLHEADFNGDGAVDGADFLRWQQHHGTTSGATLSAGDANLDGAVDGGDLGVWRALYGTSGAPPAATLIPEPAATWLSLVAALACAAQPRVARKSAVPHPAA
jgi:hypothetical protein